jgi:transcriptional regulator with XRE-family HTH domain
MYNKFVQLLQEKGLTPYAIAKATGVSNSTLSDWKNGKSVPKLDKMQLIATFLNVSTDYLLGKDISQTQAFARRLKEETEKFNLQFSAEEQNILNKLRQLNNRGIEKLDAYLDGLLTSDDYRNDAAQEVTAQNKRA